MSENSITRRVRGAPRTRQTDWPDVDRRTDEDIAAAVRGDPDAAALSDDAWFAAARLEEPKNKERITIRLDRDILDFFRDGGSQYQSRINSVLRAFVEHEKKRA